MISLTQVKRGREVGRKKAWLAVTGLLLCTLLSAGSCMPSSADETIRMHKRLVLEDPSDATLSIKLASAYIQRARESGELRDYERAEQALRRSLELNTEGNQQAYTYLAYVAYAMHRFDAAVTYAQQAVDMAPTDGYAYGLLGDGYVQMGHYASAEAAYETMLRLQPGLFSHSRYSRLQWLLGDPDSARRHMLAALDSGTQQNLPKEHIAWVQSRLGDLYASQGDLLKAEELYAASLVTYPNYHPAVAGLAFVRGAQGLYEDAVRLYEAAWATAPLPHYAAGLGDVYMKRGRTDTAAEWYARVEQVASRNALNKVLYRRELVYFYADRDLTRERALALAQEELESRKDIYSHDAMAWALSATGQHDRALAAMREALKLGTKDARLFFHAGMIHHRLGRPHEAKTYLERSLATNPSFDLLQADRARHTLRAIGHDTRQ